MADHKSYERKFTMDFAYIAACFDEIASTGSKLDKEALLEKYADIEGFKDVLKFIYDPAFTTGLKANKLCRIDYGDYDITPEEIMDYLKVYTTGTDADAFEAQTFIMQYIDDPTSVWLAEGLVTKDLQIGVSLTTLNKIYGKSFIPKIGIMRGMLCPDDASGYYICTEKIDGNRRLIFVRDDTTVDIYTRSGKRDYGLSELAADALKLPKGYMYDCECVAEGEYSDNIALRQASASLLNASGQRRGVRALCFDMVSIAEYNEGRSKISALGRKAMLAGATGDIDSCYVLQAWASVYDQEHNTNMANTVNAITYAFPSISLEHIQALPILGIATCKQDGINFAKPIWDAGGEGVMMVEFNSAYEVNPNPRKTLLKIKATKEFVCMCVGVVEGNNKYSGMLGAIEVAYIVGNITYIVRVGSGFADYQRQEYWEHPDKIVGKMVEIDSFGESVNANGGRSLNCPIFKRIRGEA